MARTKIIKDIKQYLIDENIYTDKDEMTVMLLETVYSQFLQATKDVKKNGQTIFSTDIKGNQRTVTNPQFRNQMELLKQLLKLIDALYLNPKSRKTSKMAEPDDKENPFKKMMKEISKAEMRK